MDENNIKLKSINELFRMKFFIPSYQRGYRWTEQQVTDLLNDINEFCPQKAKGTNEDTWYCLQPLVVRKMEENDSRLEKGNGASGIAMTCMTRLEEGKYTGKPSIYFNKKYAFPSQKMLFYTMGHELLHASQYLYLASKKKP